MLNHSHSRVLTSFEVILNILRQKQPPSLTSVVTTLVCQITQITGVSSRIMVHIYLPDFPDYTRTWATACNTANTLSVRKTFFKYKDQATDMSAKQKTVLPIHCAPPEVNGGNQRGT